MTVSIVLAKLYSLYLIACVIALLINRERFAIAIKGFSENSALTLVTGLFTLFLGALLVAVHNIWVLNWQLVLTILCWWVFIKGFLFLISPSFSARWVKAFENSMFFYILLFLLLILGLFLAYYGFLAK